MWGMKKRERRIIWISMSVLAQLAAFVLWAQDGNTGINQANTMIRSYFDTGVNLLYAIGGILGLVGAVKVYRHWVKGDREAESHAVSWFTACIFLVVVATILRSFFLL
jgi:hypothetical protein